MKTLIFMTVASMSLTLWALEAHAAGEEAPVTETSSAAASVAEPVVEEVAAEPAITDEPGVAKTADETPPVAETKPAPVVISGQQLPPQSGRPYYVRGTVQFRTLAISDEDPANNRSMIYGVELGYRLDSALTLFLRSGLLQRFVVPSGDTSNLTAEQAALVGDHGNQLITSPFLIRDSVAGAIYRHTEKISERSFSFAHYASLYFPTSISSQDRGLYFAPELASRGRYAMTEKFSVGIDLGLQYRFHKFAEQAGPNGGLLTQYQVASGFAADYNVFDLGEEWGRLDVGGGVSWVWQNTFDSAAGGDRWRQDYGWDLYAFYGPRPWLNLGLSLEQGAPVLRDGRVNTVLFSRDEMELTFTVSATY